MTRGGYWVAGIVSRGLWEKRPGRFAPFLVLRATGERTGMEGRPVWTFWNGANARAWVFEEADGWTLNVDGVKKREASGPYASRKAAKYAFESSQKK